jgi:hypothetical protein
MLAKNKGFAAPLALLFQWIRERAGKDKGIGKKLSVSTQ